LAVLPAPLLLAGSAKEPPSDEQPATSATCGASRLVTAHTVIACEATFFPSYRLL